MGDRRAYFEAAQRIANHVCESAVWHHDRCNWVGAMPEEGTRGTPELTYQTLGPDLYGGTAGVGLFLAEWVALSNDVKVRRTALGAFRHAVWHAGRASPALGDGLYSGRLGIAYALARAGSVLGDSELHDGARKVVAAMDLSNPLRTGNHEYDVISGLAGQVIGFLSLAGMIETSACVARASQAAGLLLAAADAIDECLCWPTTLPLAEPLLGYSHGVSGIATALLECATPTVNRAYAVAAERGFAYERMHFNPHVGNWPDRRRGKVESQPAYATFWCHGAPGIALARIRALELQATPVRREEATIALGTTRADVARVFGHPGANFSLCHGVYGNAEVLFEGRGLMSQQEMAVVDEAVEFGLERYGSSPNSWPCGTNGGSTAGLLLGLSGIGHFLLRRMDATIPSVLLLRRADAAIDHLSMQ